VTVPELLTWRALKFLLDELAYSPKFDRLATQSSFLAALLSPMMLNAMPGNSQLSSHGAINLDVTENKALKQGNVEYNGAT
jgi:hypothetical protein